jgi:hypothetical protein
MGTPEEPGQESHAVEGSKGPFWVDAPVRASVPWNVDQPKGMATARVGASTVRDGKNPEE